MIKQALLVSSTIGFMAMAQPAIAQTAPAPSAPKTVSTPTTRYVPNAMVFHRNPGFTCITGTIHDSVTCRDPAAAKMSFAPGQKIANQSRLIPYKALPFQTRMEYGRKLKSSNRYIVDENFAYGVNLTTMRVDQIAILVP